MVSAPDFSCELPLWDRSEDSEARCEFHSSNKPADLTQRLGQAGHLRTIIYEAKLSGLQPQLREIALAGAMLPSADFSGSDLYRSRLSEAAMPLAAFVGANLSNADLTGATLPRATFRDAALCQAELSRAHLHGADFRGCDMRGVKLWNTVRLRPTHLEERALEGGAHGSVLRDADLRGALLAGAGIAPETVLEGAKFGPDADGKPRDRVRDEDCAGSGAAWARWRDDVKHRPLGLHSVGHRPTFADCADIYRQLRLCFQYHGDYDRAGRFYYRERYCQRRQAAGEGGWYGRASRGVLLALGGRRSREGVLRRPVLRRLAACWRAAGFHLRHWWRGDCRILARISGALQEWCAGYGERPSWTFYWVLGTILLFGIIQGFLGIQDVPGHFIMGPGAEWPSWDGFGRFLTACYFSLITFTTTGYGDLRPAPVWGRSCAGLEALTGMALMSLFLVCIVRKFSR